MQSTYTNSFARIKRIPNLNNAIKPCSKTPQKGKKRKKKKMKIKKKKRKWQGGRGEENITMNTRICQQIHGAFFSFFPFFQFNLQGRNYHVL